MTVVRAAGGDPRQNAVMVCGGCGGFFLDYPAVEVPEDKLHDQLHLGCCQVFYCAACRTRAAAVATVPLLPNDDVTIAGNPHARFVVLAVDGERCTVRQLGFPEKPSITLPRDRVRRGRSS